jgi:molybdate transport system ATP-binding protein
MTLSVQIRKRVSALFTIDLAAVVSPGITIVFGESGSGKTTLLRCVAGLIRPDDGQIMAGDRVLFDSTAGVDVAPAGRRVGMVFQHLALFPHMSAADNIAYGLAELPGNERSARTAAAAESMRIGHLLGSRPGQISGGERQRVALARTLVTNPDVLLLDEPLAALDYNSQSRIIADLRVWNRARQIPILYVTHSQREVFALGERVLVLQGGAIIADGTPQQVMESPSRDSMAQLAGFENLLDATVVRRRADVGVMVARLAGAPIDIETPLADVAVDRPVRLAIRAGDILIAIEPPSGLSARNVLPGIITSLAHEGSLMRVCVDVGVPIEVHVTPTSSEELGLRPGRSVWIIVKTHSCRPVTTI